MEWAVVHVSSFQRKVKFLRAKLNRNTIEVDSTGKVRSYHVMACVERLANFLGQLLAHLPFAEETWLSSGRPAPIRTKTDYVQRHMWWWLLSLAS